MDKRNEVQNNLKKMGYQHPERENIVFSPYLNYSESGENPYVVGNGSGYMATSSASYEDYMGKCPVCDSRPKFVCECEEFKDNMCKNGHVWYLNKKGEVITGNPHENDAR